MDLITDRVSSGLFYRLTYLIIYFSSKFFFELVQIFLCLNSYKFTKPMPRTSLLLRLSDSLSFIYCLLVLGIPPSSHTRGLVFISLLVNYPLTFPTFLHIIMFIESKPSLFNYIKDRLPK